LPSDATGRSRRSPTASTSSSRRPASRSCEHGLGRFAATGAPPASPRRTGPRTVRSPFGSRNSHTRRRPTPKVLAPINPAPLGDAGRTRREERLPKRPRPQPATPRGPGRSPGLSTPSDAEGTRSPPCLHPAWPGLPSPACRPRPPRW
jgi:hypothetical protein